MDTFLPVIRSVAGGMNPRLDVNDEQWRITLSQHSQKNTARLWDAFCDTCLP
jgi:hypothetical protein